MYEHGTPPGQGAILPPHVDQVANVNEDVEAVGEGAHGGVGVHPVAKEHERPDTTHVPEADGHHAAAQAFGGIPLEIEATVEDDRGHAADEIADP